MDVSLLPQATFGKPQSFSQSVNCVLYFFLLFWNLFQLLCFPAVILDQVIGIDDHSVKNHSYEYLWDVSRRTAPGVYQRVVVIGGESDWKTRDLHRFVTEYHIRELKNSNVASDRRDCCVDADGFWKVEGVSLFVVFYFSFLWHFARTFCPAVDFCGVWPLFLLVLAFQILNHRKQDPTGLRTKAVDFNVKCRGFCIDERDNSPMWISETDLSPALYQPWEGSELQYYWQNNFGEFFLFCLLISKETCPPLPLWTSILTWALFSLRSLGG